VPPCPDCDGYLSCRWLQTKFGRILAALTGILTESLNFEFEFAPLGRVLIQAISGRDSAADLKRRTVIQERGSFIQQMYLFGVVKSGTNQNKKIETHSRCHHECPWKLHCWFMWNDVLSIGHPWTADLDPSDQRDSAADPKRRTEPQGHGSFIQQMHLFGVVKSGTNQNKCQFTLSCWRSCFPT
jgi:hypothetical protein